MWRIPALVFLFACGTAPTPPTVPAIPEVIDVIDEDGRRVTAEGSRDDGRFTVEGEDGTLDVTTGGWAAMPAGYPLPAYPGSVITMVGLSAPPGDVVMLSTVDPPASVGDFYQPLLPPPVLRSDQQGTVSLLSDTPDGKAMVSAVSDGRQTAVTLTVDRR